ncbi:hypothetical protein [Shewanella algae]|uniref:hypothetical protein n=1 Tax=Shewanella algae TaxID=38313 RepID=UPI000F425B9E|nr:hypothetical protein [Shewanella algae]AYV14324.1 hypothetical protein EEY24_16390 [Shewanella algae]
MTSEWTTPEMIIAMSSVVIALCALGATLWQGYLTRKHNRLTVKPISSFYVSLSAHEDKIGIKFENKGYGPLIFTKSEISKNGKYFGLNDPNSMGLFNKLKSSQVHFNYPGVNAVLAPGESVWLVCSSEHKKNSELIQIMENEIVGLAIKIEFESIYGDKNSDSLELL